MFGNGMNFPNMNMCGMNNMPLNMPNMNMCGMTDMPMNIPMNMPMNMPINMQNIQMNMPNILGINNMSNAPMTGMNIGGNDNWMMGYGIGINNQNQMQNSPGKTNIVFKTTQGMIKNIPIENEKTISEAIKIYLNRVGKPELFNRTKDICFLCNANKLDINSTQKIGDFFTGFFTPNIIVNDVKNLIGASYLKI